MAEETTPNQPEQTSTNTEAKATDIPTANAPEPEVAKPDAVSTTPEADTAPKKPAAKRSPKADIEADGAEKPAAKAKKEKPPALEDKLFADFIQQDYLPALKAGLVKQDIPNADLTFEKRKINVIGFAQAPECWQVVGRWTSVDQQSREFSIYFFDEKINGQKGFSYSESGGRASTLESFRIDERKVDLGLLVFWTLQRLNAQKWLVRN